MDFELSNVVWLRHLHIAKCDIESLVHVLTNTCLFGLKKHLFVDAWKHLFVNVYTMYIHLFVRM